MFEQDKNVNLNVSYFGFGCDGSEVLTWGERGARFSVESARAEVLRRGAGPSKKHPATKWHIIHAVNILSFQITTSQILVIIFIPNFVQKAKRSYQKDVTTFKEARDSNANALVAQENGQGTANGSAFSGGEIGFFAFISTCCGYT